MAGLRAPVQVWHGAASTAVVVLMTDGGNVKSGGHSEEMLLIFIHFDFVVHAQPLMATHDHS